MKKLLSLLLAVLMVLSLAACGGNDDAVEETTEEEGYKIAVVTDVGQLNDGGFNQGTYEGAVAFAEANGLTYKYYQPANGSDATDDDRVAAMRQAIENGAEVIVTPGYLQYTAIATVANENPEVKWIFVDGWTDDGFKNSNVTAISYHEEESAYLAGYAAVMDGYTKFGGTFGGGGTNLACNRFSYGYVQGINDASKELGIKSDVTISFLYGASFSASNELQTQISGWYTNGAEVVFSCGGSMVNSVLAAANETENGKVIGVDVDQAYLSERVITSATKGLAASVQKVLGQWLAGEWDSALADQTSNLGAADNATGIPTNEDSWRFSKFSIEDYAAVMNKIIDGTIVIDATGYGACDSVNFKVEE